MIIAYKSGAGIAVTTILNNEFFVSDYIILDSMPESPIETLYIEGGKIKIDQQKLIEFNRSQMPDLSRIEFKYKLHKAGKLEEVEQFIKTTDNFLLQLAYNEAQFFSRTDPLLSQALEDLGWTEAQVDEIWTS